DPVRLAGLVEIVRGLAALAPPVVFPVHPRTAARLEATGLRAQLDVAGVELMEPLPYGAMLDALGRSLLVVTDSGGLQEEASWLGLPAVILRRSTPRWEGVRAGASVLVGMDVDHALAAAARLLDPVEQERVAAIPCPYGDGTTGPTVADILADPATASLLELAEPDFTDGSLPASLADDR
ncbi:MAG: UDP-N-acetylglucosamine 2-epimerase, partial [Actinomycetota bacterium]|nr:UDP-N-acetylglucosamine 2-epimerase [Actinomycetota bacterium]